MDINNNYLRETKLGWLVPISCSIVMVLGAGRGPLVTASLKAAEQADRKVIVYAVEKNPNAAVT